MPDVRRGGMVRLMTGLIVAVAFAAQAHAQEFPEYFVPPAVEHALFPDRDALVEALLVASKARKHYEGVGYLLDPAPLAALMASSIVFIASGDNPAGAEFKLLGRYPPGEALTALGSLAEGEHPEAVVMQRRGMHVVGAALADPTIGPSDWLGGRQCTAAYGKIDQMAFADLVRDTGFEPRTWSIVLPGEADPPWLHEVEPYLLVSLEDLGSRNASLWALNLPDGTSLVFRNHGFGFERLAPYLRSHACFDVTAEGMKLKAIAMRLD